MAIYPKIPTTTPERRPQHIKETMLKEVGEEKKQQKDEMKEQCEEEEEGEKLYFQQVSRGQESIDTKTTM